MKLIIIILIIILITTFTLIHKWTLASHLNLCDFPCHIRTPSISPQIKSTLRPFSHNLWSQERLMIAQFFHTKSDFYSFVSNFPQYYRFTKTLKHSLKTYFMTLKYFVSDKFRTLCVSSIKLERLHRTKGAII